MNPIRPIIDRLALLVAGTLGRIIGRPSEDLLSELAAADRGSPNPSPSDSPMIEASHHIQLGQAAFALESYGEALHHFGKAIQLAPHASWAWHGRGDALQLSGEYDGALKAYEKAIENDERCGLHHAGKANSLDALGQHEAAKLAWENALRHDPSLTWMRDGSKKP
jgi:tetratricopeptide (TPR) repeat protein